MAIPDKRPLKVFLCHAHADREPVRALYNRLVKDGVDAWLDKEKLLGGADWEYEIRKAVRESDVVIVCHSQQFNQRGFRQKEVKIALEEADLLPKGEIFIIPVRLEECDVLDDLKRWHWVDLFEEDGYERLMRALRVRANRIGATLQAKRSWLPKITSPRSSTETPIKEKEPTASTKIKPEAVKDEDEAGLQNADKGLSEDEDTAEKVAQEKIEKEIQRRLEKSIKKAKRDLWWEKFKIDINYRLELIRIYRVPILILLVTLVIVIPLSLDLANKIPELSQILTKTPISTVALTTQLIVPSHTSKPILKPTETFLPSKTPLASATPTTTSLPPEITDAKGVQMVLVPAGDFTFGDISTGSSKVIYIDSFYIDKYEVTNAQYKDYVVANGSQEWMLPRQDNSNHRSHYYGNPLYDNYPVIYIDIGNAIGYCGWRNARIPTSEEWEKAARGTDGRLYPWGDDKPNCSLSNFADCTGDTTKVGNYEAGKSSYGVYDLAGNVWEWVSTGYVDEYVWGYSFNHVLYELRGGAWDSSVDKVSVFFQLKREVNRDNSYIYYNNGFRCVRAVVP